MRKSGSICNASQRSTIIGIELLHRGRVFSMPINPLDYLQFFFGRAFTADEAGAFALTDRLRQAGVPREGLRDLITHSQLS